MEKGTEKTKPHPIDTGNRNDQIRVKSQEVSSPLSKRDSGYDSPGNVLHGKTQFTFGEPVMWETASATSDEKDELFEEEPQDTSTPSRSQPIAIPRESRSQRRTGANAPLYQEVPSPLGLSPIQHRPAPLMHRFSTGSFPQDLLDQATGRCDCRREVGTQTTHIAGQMVSHAIRGELVLEHGPMCGVHGLVHRISFVGSAVEQIRHVGNNDVVVDDDDDDEDSGQRRQRAESTPLPDIVPFSRGRAMSVPALRRIRTESEIGQELRRISDEFHLSYRSEYKEPEKESSQDQQASSFPGTRHQNEGFLTRIRHFFFERRNVPEPHPRPQRQRRYTGDGLVHQEQSETSDSD